jgi:small GTP-binding protein
MFDGEFKIVVAGRSGVGKTNIITQFTKSKYTDGIKPTIGATSTTIQLNVDNESLALSVWDIPGDERYRALCPVYFSGAAAALLVFDLTERSSFGELNVWLNDVRTSCEPNACILLVGNKSDLPDERRISEEEARDFARQNDLDYLEVSAKTGHSLREAFTQLVRRILNQCTSASVSPAIETPTQPIRHQEITLSSSGLSRVNFLEQDSFRFIVGQHECLCSRFQAAFISPRISDLLQCDVTVNVFVLEGVEDNESNIELLRSFLEGRVVTVTHANYSIIHEIASQLGNDELNRIIFDSQDSGDDLNESNAISRLTVKLIDRRPFEEEVRFIASHLCEIDSVGSLSIEQLELILQSEFLQIESEEWLLNFIYDRGSDYRSLLRFVQCEFLGCESMAKYIELIDVECLNSMIWSSICCRLVNSQSTLLPFGRSRHLQIPHIQSDFQGIIHCRAKECEGNVHEQGLVDISVSGSAGGDPIEVVNFDHPSNWNSANSPNSWIRFDFKDRRVCIDSYTVNSGMTDNWLKSWVLQLSNDCQKWIPIHTTSDCNLGGRNVTRHFGCSTSVKEYYRYIRLRQTGPNANNSHQLGLGNIEFFGKLQSSSRR